MTSNASKTRDLCDISNVAAARMVACITSLASALQHTHGHRKPTPMAKDQEVPNARLPAVDCLIHCSHLVLGSRASPTAKALTKKMAQQNSTDFLNYCSAQGATYLEQTIALIVTLEGLRKSRFGMPDDENVLSLTVYNIHTAYQDLIAADGIDVRADVVDRLTKFRTMSLIR